MLATDIALASNWVIGLNPGSSGQAQSSSVNNLTVAAVAVASPVNLLYPGGTGDAFVKITNPNSFPVTVTAVGLPSNTSAAAGYSDPGLTSSVAGCGSAQSGVTWSFATSASGTSHTLQTALVVSAASSLTVTLTNDATMAGSSPAACEAVYFSMPSLTGVTASAGGSPPTANPATDSWTS